MKALLSTIFFMFLVSDVVVSQQEIKTSDSLEITNILFKQQRDWNKGDIDAFMEGYLKSQSLVFSGSSGPIYGWEATRNRYKKTYSNRIKMGKLKFDILNIIGLSPTVIQLQGKFYLTRTIEDASGYFTLNWIKIKKQWYIISDHTSSSK